MIGINQHFAWVRMNRIDHDTEKAVRRFLTMIASRYDMAEAIVYGSRARGTHRPDSAADVAVLLHGEHQRFLTAKLDMADVAFDVLLETGILVSPLPIWLDEWEHPENYSNPALLRNINREGVRLWAIDNRRQTRLDGEG
jgi:predicted nucleotidyltransferase